MKSTIQDFSNEPSDGDWSLVDLSEPITEEATKVAHAMGMNFEQFMYLALEEKLATLRNDKVLMQAADGVHWTPLLKGTAEMIAKHDPDKLG